MGEQLDRSAFSATEFRLNLTISGQTYNDYGFQTLTIPGMGDASTEDFKLNNDQRTVVTSPGTDNNFTFTTSFTSDFFDFRQAAKELATYTAVLSGITNSAFAGDTVTISGTVASPGDLEVGVDGVPTFTFNGTTSYINFQEGN